MERKRRKGINVTEGKRNIITALINETSKFCLIKFLSPKNYELKK